MVLLVAAAWTQGAAPPVPGPVALTAEQLKHVQKLTEQANKAFAALHFEDGARLWRQIAKFREEYQGARHREVIDARLLAERLQRLSKVPKESHAKVPRALALHTGGQQLSGQGRYREAEERHRQALDLYRKVLGEEHPETASSYNSLVACLFHQGKQGEALPLYKKALAIRRKVLGEEHPRTAQSYSGVALCLGAQGQHGNALPPLRQAQGGGWALGSSSAWLRVWQAPRWLFRLRPLSLPEQNPFSSEPVCKADYTEKGGVGKVEG
jgi:tetratricopeptide (TPR) repeat protein